MGAECGYRRIMETPPQESRRRSRRGRSTAVASLACHGICAWRLVPRTPRHMPRQSSRSLGCAVAARRQLPLLPPKAAGSAAAADPCASLQGGLVREAVVGRRRRECDFVGIKGAPSSPRSFERRRVCSQLVRASSVKATPHPIIFPRSAAWSRKPCSCTVAVRPRRKLLRATRHRAASSQYQPLHVPVQWLLTSSGRESLPPAGTLHARQSLRFVPVMESCSPTPCAAAAPSSLWPRGK